MIYAACHKCANEYPNGAWRKDVPDLSLIVFPAGIAITCARHGAISMIPSVPAVARQPDEFTGTPDVHEGCGGTWRPHPRFPSYIDVCSTCREERA